VARKFFYVCAGLLCLALAYHFGARSATAQGGAPADIATGTYELNEGDPVPMPHYPDGSEARPSECTYAVAAYTGYFAFPAPYVMEGLHVRVADGGTAPKVEAHLWNEQGRTFAAHVAISVIAIRVAQPTSTAHESWGALKGRYR
jgi:hypothetical protein